jgi:hypothetical protein
MRPSPPRPTPHDNGTGRTTPAAWPTRPASPSRRRASWSRTPEPRLRVPATQAFLESTRADLRGWEWRYVHRLCHSNLLTLKHTSPVTSASFSPDGSRIVTGSEDGTAKVWDARPVEYTLPVRQGETKLDRQSQSAVGTGPLRNPGFEDGLKGWETAGYGARPTLGFDSSVLREGRQSVRVWATQPSDTAFGQEVMLKPGQSYRLAGWVRTRGLRPHGSPVYGTFQVQLSMGQGTIASGTNHGGDTEWTEVTITFKATASGRTRICAFFAGFGKGTGAAWFDDLKLVELNDSPR